MPQPPQHVEKFEYIPLAAKTSAGKLLESVGRFIGGLPLGLSVLAMIIIASSVGELLDHESEQSLKLVFHTGWFRALLFIQAVNLVFNTYFTYVDSTHAQFQPIFRKSPDHYKPLKINFKVGFKEAKPKDSLELIKSLAGALAAKGYRVFYDKEGIYAHRGLLARFGSTITHLGLIIIIAGALVESFFKIEGNVALAEGETGKDYSKQPDFSDQNPLGFDVTLNDFEFTEYPGTGPEDGSAPGTAKKFKSTVTFTTPDGKKHYEYVRVNHDVRFHGWKFHQSSYQILQDNQAAARFFVNLEERLPSGETKLRRFETYVPKRGREISPIPGLENRFFAIENAPSGEGLIWTVASKEGILARGAEAQLSELKIKLLDFYPDHETDAAQGKVVKKGDQLGEPAALIQITVNDKVAFRDWVYDSKSPKSKPDKDGVSFVITNVEMGPAKVGMAGRPADALMGSVDKASVAQADGAAPGGEGPVVTIELQHKGEASERVFRLKQGESALMGGGSDPRYNIPGNFKVQSLHKIQPMMSIMSVSWNPGVPIVWVGAIFATFGPVLAFFISRRRVWATLDWTKKTLHVGGESRYTREALEDEIAEVIEAWGASKEAQLQPAPKLPRVGTPPISSEV